MMIIDLRTLAQLLTTNVVKLQKVASSECLVCGYLVSSVVINSGFKH